jgi:2-haloacid dehalogenase
MDFRIDRRRFLAGAGATAISIPELQSILAPQANRKTQELKRELAPDLTPELKKVKALVFDTFGTVVDWRSSVTAEGMTWGKAKGLQIDWAQFADRWRLGYRPAMDRVRKGQIPWTRLDDLHRMILEDLLKEYKIQGLTEEEKVRWTYVWRRLKPWPDSVEGLTRLRKKYIIAPL